MPAVPDMRLASARDNLSFYPSRLIAILVLKPDVMDKTILRIRQFSRFLTYPEQECRKNLQKDISKHRRS